MVSIVLQRVLAGKLITELPPEYVDYVRHNEQIEELMYHLEITYNVTLSQWERSFISFPLTSTQTIFVILYWLMKDS